MPVKNGDSIGTVHIIGAGLAGLSAAVQLAKNGVSVELHEAAGHGGGRCRSFYDETLGCRIDNGNHLLLSGNTATQDYLRQIGSETSLIGSEPAEFPFLDLKSGEKWTVKPDAGLIPWSLFFRKNRVPGSSFFDYLRGLSLAWAGPDATIQDCLAGKGRLFERFWEPLAVSVLNTEAEAASARLLWPVMKETFGRGAAACVPLMVKDGLSESFVDPALAYLDAAPNKIVFNHRLKSLVYDKDRVATLIFADAKVNIADADRVILALPSGIANKLIPELGAPDAFRPIVNGHFEIPNLTSEVKFMGLVGGSSHWLFVRNDIASVTVSAASDLVEQPSEVIAARLWEDICTALDLGKMPVGKYRIVKEKRATFAQTPEQVTKRPNATTAAKNLFLAGDWTDNGLPATIEGTIRSGFRAAELAVG